MFVYKLEPEIEWKCDHCYQHRARLGVTIYTAIHRLCVGCAGHLYDQLGSLL